MVFFLLSRMLVVQVVLLFSAVLYSAFPPALLLPVLHTSVHLSLRAGESYAAADMDTI